MSFDYDNARAVAESLITKFGQPASFIKEGAGGGGYDDFGNPIPAEPDIVIDGIIAPLLQFKKMEIDGEQIKSSDSYVFFHSDDEPPIGSKVTVNGSEYRALYIWKLTSVGGTNDYRKIQLRR